MELLASLGGSLAFGMGGAWLARDEQARRRLHAGPPAEAWLALALWIWSPADVGPTGRPLATGVLLGCLSAVLVFTLVAQARTVTWRTSWFVIPCVMVVCAGAACSTLVGYMGIQDAWL